MPDMFGFDCYSPKEVAERVENVGVAKANLPLLPMSALGVLAGGFIGLGAMFATLVTSDPKLGFAAARVLGGVAFSLGLILVVVAGAELFTGNNLLVMGWMGGRITTGKFLQNIVVIYLANLLGSLGLVVIVYLSNQAAFGGNAVGANAVKIASIKTALPFGEAFYKGILCNVLVCLAVWLAMAGRNVVDKILAIVFPITAFVAAGFEHCVANMYFIPLGILLHGSGGAFLAAQGETLNWTGFVHNLVPVTLGNFVGGGVMVALVYWIIYRRGTTGKTATENRGET